MSLQSRIERLEQRREGLRARARVVFAYEPGAVGEPCRLHPSCIVDADAQHVTVIRLTWN